LLSTAQAFAPAEEPEWITYLFEDFETYTPGLWCGRPEAQGNRAAETENVHGGRRAVVLSWDLTKCSDPGMNFANFVFHRRMVGQVQEVRAWLWAAGEARGTPLVLWVSDRNGEMYIQRTNVDWTGWKQVTFSLVGVGPGWESGDRNHQPDPPLSVFGLAVDFGGPKRGKLILDDMEVVTLATPREALAFTPSTEAEKNLFWGERPVIRLPVRNEARRAVRGVRCELRVEDLYRERDVWTGPVDYEEIAGNSVVERTQTLDVPYGVYRVHWRLADGQGELLTGSLDVSRLRPPCYRDAPESVRDYDRRWSIFGGVFGSFQPQLASDMGARWIRYEDTVWSDYEKEPGRLEMASLVKGLRRYQEAGIESIILQTLYQRPAFYNPDQPGFARAYGEVMRRAAQTARGLANCFELGNEDNGPTKMLYAEVARHGAAGIRSAQPHALIANSGTAFIDLGWLEWQAARGVMDWLDALCTHPYTVNESPDAWDIFGRLEQVNDLIDRLGGMKVQWTTEFGWHHEFSPPRRAEWIPRHFLIGAAAGIERHGLYTWERDYGIFQGPAQPPAASVHALSKMLEGHRFVGLLHQSEDLWACVWERAGTPLAIAWSPTGDAEWSVEVAEGHRAQGTEHRAGSTDPNPPSEVVRVFDLFGNPLPVQSQDGRLTIHLDGGPVYVTGVADSVLEQAVRNQCEREHARFVKCLEAFRQSATETQRRGDYVWDSLAQNSRATGADLDLALRSWTPASTPIQPAEQAVVAQALRWFLTAGRPLKRHIEMTLPQRLQAKRQSLRERLEMLAAQDTDVPSLRYLLDRWDRLAAEERMARELGADSLSPCLLGMQETLAMLCERFAEHGERKLFSLWPYLYTVAEDGTLQETLHFVPGESTSIKVRVNSYSQREHTVTVSLKLPEGWRWEPDPLRLTVPPGVGAEAEVQVHCPPDVSVEKPVLECVLQVEKSSPLTKGGLEGGQMAKGGLEGGQSTLPFDDVVIEAPVRLAVEPLPGLLPQTPLRATLSNPGAQPVSGRLRLLRKGDTRALARAEFKDLSAEQPQPLELQLAEVPPLPYHEWPLIAQFTLTDGRRVERPVGIDFACAVRAETPPTIDGNLEDWTQAAPLHLDRIEYSKGSFGGKWSPEDLSATTYTMWDDQFFYFAARVTDQTFNQTLSGTSQWIQDSLQFSLARDPESPRTEIGLALTPQGEEVVSYTAPPPAPPYEGGEQGGVSGSRLKVVLQQGGAIYEAAIPWSEIEGLEQPEAGATIRYAVLVNDDDAVTGRRFLERYGGIAHEKDIADFGYLTLLPGGDEVPVTVLPSPNRGGAGGEVVFIEDFEEYEDGQRPDAWEAVSHQPPVPETKVVAGAGRNGSKGLVLVNTVGPRPYVYLNLYRPLTAVRPDERYELRFWVRGRGVEATGGIVGVCSDPWGNESFAYAEHGTVGEEWKEVVFPFSGPTGGRLNLILRNCVKMDELVLDDLRITRL